MLASQAARPVAQQDTALTVAAHLDGMAVALDVRGAQLQVAHLREKGTEGKLSRPTSSMHQGRQLGMSWPGGSAGHQ